MPRRRGLHPRLLAAVIRSKATLAFAAERQVVGQTVTIAWRTDGGKSEYYYGEIEGSKVTAQIGRSTNAGRYVWSVFHADIGCAIFGDEEPSLDGAKQKAQAWVDRSVKR